MRPGPHGYTPGSRDAREKSLRRQLSRDGYNNDVLHASLRKLIAARVAEGRFCADSAVSMAKRDAAEAIIECAVTLLDEASEAAGEGTEAAKLYADGRDQLEDVISLIEGPNYSASDC